MDTTDPEITFDESGNCNHCTEFINKRSLHKYKGEESDRALDAIIEEMKIDGKGKEYDCIIGLSGGIDSCYAAYIAKQRGLRVLAVHLDNGWNSEEAVQNIKSVAQKLDIDYESYVLDWHEFKDLQLSFLKASVPEAETPTDIAIMASWHHFTSKYNVRYIISGGNFATEGILPKFWHYDAKDKRYLTGIHKKFGTVRLKKFPTFGFMKEMYHKLVKKTKIIYLLNYVPYAKNDAMEFLKKELDWKYYGGKHYESKYTGFIQSYYLVKKFGLDYRRATFSSQICTGDVTREEALEELKTTSYASIDVEKEKAYLAKKLGISLEEFTAIIDLPPKWYTDYPNNEKKLGFVYNMYRKLFKKEKLGSF
jgi:N-acetyl sugar amidotransferase